MFVILQKKLILETITKLMKKFIYAIALCALPLIVLNCRKDDKEDKIDEEVEQLVGNPGNPRFNLQFTNPTNVDLDLYVKTPSGKVIYYGNKTADQGRLDVDCLCGICPQGPNENIYWTDGTAPKGTYEFWVEYYDDCGTRNSSSDFTVRLIKNDRVLQKYTGTLNSEGQKSTKWTHTQN